MSKIYIISELCGQWGGSVSRAKKMISQSKAAGADAVKVQLWDTYRLPGENREKWEYLSMTREQFLDLKDYSDKLNIDFFASAFHEDRFNWILEANLKINKIASLLLDIDYDLCKTMVDSGIKTYCSLGKWTKKDMPFDNPNVEYFHCVSKYPHTLADAKSLMPKKLVYPIGGYSDHVEGIDACKEAVRRGAKTIEKHFTLDHNMQSDTEGAHICSMNYRQLKDFRKFCDNFDD